ncbi:MAG TPA: hypothetical protein PKD70_05880 [Saprospiraceae bacterium]|nr:hypothetical protein [Saprospiraceae bacterium]HMP13389.1 hypothetical protein [Saprospiraceae bacterium]
MKTKHHATAKTILNDILGIKEDRFLSKEMLAEAEIFIRGL